MAIYTSNYARQGSHPNAIAISRKPPDWFKGEHMPEFAPTWDMIMGLKEGKIDHQQYTKMYFDLLINLRLDSNKIVGWLNSTPDPTFFLCYETPRDFCHRHLFSQWIQHRTGWWIPEWKNEKELEQERQGQVVDDLLGF